MSVQVDEVVEAHIAGKLELQHDVMLLDFSEQLLSLSAVQLGAIETMTDAQIREALSGQKSLLHQRNGLGHIAFQRIVFAGVDADRPVFILRCDLCDDLPNDRFQLSDVVDLLTNKVAAHHIRVLADHFQSLNGLGEVVAGDDILLHQRQRNAADGRKEADIHTGLRFDERKNTVDLRQHPRIGSVLFHQRGVADLHILDVFFLVLSADPQESVLIQRQVGVDIAFFILQRLQQAAADVAVLDAIDVLQFDAVIRRQTLGEHIAIQVELLQIGEHRLRAFQQGKGAADLIDVFRGLFDVAQNQIGKVDEGIVVDLAFPILSAEGGQIKASLHVFSLCIQHGLLCRRQTQAQLFHIVQRIADLMLDSQRDENIGIQIGVAVGVEVGGQLHFFRHIGFDQSFPEGILVILGLAHQCFGNSGNQRIDLDLAVGVDVCQLGAVETENIHPLPIAFDVAGNFPADNGFSVLYCGFLSGSGSQIVDEVVGLMITHRNRVAQDRLFHVQTHHDILFFIKINASEVAHNITCFLSLLYHRNAKKTGMKPVFLMFCRSLPILPEQSSTAD